MRRWRINSRNLKQREAYEVKVALAEKQAKEEAEKKAEYERTRPRLVNGHYKDPMALPHETKLSLKPRILNAHRPNAKAKALMLAQSAGMNISLRPLPGSCRPGQAPNPLGAPKYTERPSDIQFPLAGSGAGVNKEEDPILQQIEPAAPRAQGAQGAKESEAKQESVGAKGKHKWNGTRDQHRAAEIKASQIKNAEEMFRKQRENRNIDLGKDSDTVFPNSPTENQTPANPAAQPPSLPAPVAHSPQYYSTRTFNVPDKPNLTDVRALAKIYTQAALDVLVEIMHDPSANANARVTAAEAVLNRGWGKPDQQTQITLKKHVDQFSDEEILAILSSANITLDAEEVVTDATESGDNIEGTTPVSPTG
jgi:hypothetical protein